MPAADDMSGRVWIGILLFCGTTFFFASLDMLAKVLARGFDPVQVVWGRYFFHSAVLLPMVLRRGAVRAFATGRPAMQIGRALLLCTITLMFFVAIKHLPLVDAQAISFIMPLVLTALAHFLLEEKVGPRRWAAVIIGFFGVMLVIRPGGEGGVHWAALLCVAMAVLNACFHLLTRVLSRTDSAEVAVVYSGFTGAAVFSCLVPFVWIAPDPGEWALLAAIGLMGAAGHYCLSRAYVYARASVLAPYAYLQMVWVAGYGYAVFADVPSPATIVGSCIVVAAGLYIFYRERVAKGV